MACVILVAAHEVRRWLARSIVLPLILFSAMFGTLARAQGSDHLASQKLRNTLIVRDAFDAVARFEDPIVITKGGTYSGRFESQVTSVPAITVLTSEPVVIENSTVRSAGVLIAAPWSDVNLTIRNVVGEATYPTVAGQTAGRFLHAEGYQRIVVEGSSMVGTSGIYLNASHRGATVQIVGNVATNIDGRVADGAGGYEGAEFVQFVQLNAGNALSDSEIAWNRVENHPGVSRVEDVISLFRTSGRPDDPIEVHHNFLRGAYPEDPSAAGFSGGGIMLGDGGGSYQRAYANTVVGTNNYGAAISGGHHNELRDNLVIGSGVTSDGQVLGSQNVGIYIWNHYGQDDFGFNVGTGNRVAWAHPEHGRNDWWHPDADAWHANVHLGDGEAVTLEMEAEAYASWLVAAADAQIAVLGAVSEVLP